MKATRLLVVSALLLAGCIGHVFGLPFLVAAEVEEAECRRHLPAGVSEPDAGALLYACELDGGVAFYELIGTNCSDIPQPPPLGSWRCELDGGRSSWREEVWQPQPEAWPPCDSGECGGTSELSDSPSR